MNVRKLQYVWTVPFQRNLFFTGRESILGRLHEALNTQNQAVLAQPQGLSGLGGIGKTQVAVEYAYRYREEYQTVLWVGGDSHEALNTGFIALATALTLPERNERDQHRIIEAVQRWFRSHSNWLLIVDNVENVMLVNEFLPKAYSGHILLTTRSHAMGHLAQNITIEKMTPEVGSLLLLRRAGILEKQGLLNEAMEDIQEQAIMIAQVLDGLPLAIDQAGAYIQEIGCSLSEYLTRYHTRHTQLFKRRGKRGSDHPETVATTWSLSFEKVQQENPSAAELLRFCAFLSPDAIPEEIFTENPVVLEHIFHKQTVNSFQLNQAIRTLLRFSLLQRSPTTHTLTVHRLVQMVLKDRMRKPTQRHWSERVIQAIHYVFPQVHVEVWELCERYLPHALVCSDLINAWQLKYPEAARLLYWAGYYLEERAQYKQAEQILSQARSVYESLYGTEHPDVATSLNSLAEVYRAQSRYVEAEPLYQHAVAIREKFLSPEHLDTAQSYSNLGSLYCNQGRYLDAEPYYQKTLTIRTQLLANEHQEIAFALSNLGALYYHLGKYAEAEPLYRQALAITEHRLGPEHLDVVINLNNMALLYRVQNRNEEAIQLLMRSLAIREKVLGSEHPDVATTLTNLAGLYRVIKQYAQVETFYQRALHIYEEAFESQHPNAVLALNGLAAHYLLQQQYERARPLYLQAIDICKHIGRSEHTDMAVNLNGLATLYYYQGKYVQAESMYQQALAIYERMLGAVHRDVANCLSGLGMLYNRLEKDEAAEACLQRALTITLQVLGSEHPDVLQCMYHLAVSYYNQGKYSSAESLYEETLEKQKSILGPKHSAIVDTLEKLAKTCEAQGKFTQADAYYQLTILQCEQAYSPYHPNVARSLDKYGAYLQRQNKKKKANRILSRVHAIRENYAQQEE